MKIYWLLLLVALPAQADLYRWIDPATGTVKLSSLPPADPGIEAEVIRYNAPPPPKPPATLAIVKPVPPTAIAELEGRWRSLVTQLTGLTPQDFNKGSDGLRQHMEAYESVRAELDRLDPAGAARRNAESTTMIERLKQAFTRK